MAKDKYELDGVNNKAEFARRGRKTLTEGQNYNGKCYGFITYQDSEVTGTLAKTEDMNQDTDTTYNESLPANFDDYGVFISITCTTGRIAIFLD